MRKSAVSTILFLLLSLIGAGASASLVISQLVSELSATEYRGHVEALEGFGTRYYNQQGNLNALQYLDDGFTALGLSVRYDAYQHNGTKYNIEATLPGTLYPDDIILVGAHFDSTSNAAATNAPGADDNATGVAAVLAIASVFSNYQFESTIRFVGFNSEEQGLIGSAAYATSAKARGDDIGAMFNFDMIGYTGGNANEDLEILGAPWLVDTFLDSAAFYVPDLPTQGHYNNYQGSDHYNFQSSRYPGSSSIMAIEDTANEIWGGSNPYYHSTDDTSDRLDWDFAMNTTRAGAATIAELGGAMAVPEPPMVLLIGLGLLSLPLGFVRRGTSAQTRSDR